MLCKRCGFKLELDKTFAKAFTKTKRVYRDDKDHCRFCQANCPELGKT